MTTRANVEGQFIRWNFAGAGNDRLTGGNWRFRKNVLFYSDSPYKRVVRDGSGKPLLLVREHSRSDDVLTQPNIINAKSGIAYKTWTVPEIGVMSRFEGDELSEKDLHERQHYLMIAEMAALMEERVAIASGADLDKAEGRNIMGTADKMVARYFNYQLIFKLGWGEMPRMYRERLVTEIKAKVSRYHDPKQVAQRERLHARKIAKQAFGLA